MKMISFNIPPYVGTEMQYIKEAIELHKICGDGKFTKLCNNWIEQQTGTCRALLTTSGTHALEMAALLCDLQPGDEVILPSFTFSSTANAFLLVGAKLIFVDIRPDNMNIDETKIEAAISSKTRVICVTHYAGVACEMNIIMDIAARYNLSVVEDAAQAIMSSYHGKALGTFGRFGCFSFHETKNYSMGEGGALLIKDENDVARAEILREKGTDRSKFIRGQVDKYTWIDYGSSYLPSDLIAAYLWAQLQVAQEINQNRLDSWNMYYRAFLPLQEKGLLHLPVIQKECEHNAHMFFLKLKDIEERNAFIEHMKCNNILCVFHYIPLHSSPAGIKYGRFSGQDKYTTACSNQLVRLPMYFNLTQQDKERVIQSVYSFFNESWTRG